MHFKCASCWNLVEVYTHGTTAPIHYPRKGPHGPLESITTVLCPRPPCSDFCCHSSLLPFLELYINGIYNMYSFVSGLFGTQYFWDSFMVLYVSVICFFLLWNDIQMYKYITICLSLSSDRQLGCFQFYTTVHKTAGTFVYKSVNKCFYLFPSEFLEVKLMGHRVDTCLTLYETGQLFFKVVIAFYTLSMRILVVYFLTSSWGFRFLFVGFV